MNGSRSRVTLLLALTFVAGAAGGVAADRFGLLPGIARADQPESAREHRRPGRETTIEKFADELELTRSQREEIEGILDHYRRAMRDMWKEVRPRYHSLVDSVRTRIETVLTPEQAAEYRALLEERERRREKRRHERSEEGR